MFKIDQRIEKDTLFCCDLSLSSLYLMNDKKYPWFILVPRIEDVYDLTDLEFSSQIKLLEEINIVDGFLRENYQYDKLNVASLGNVVKQLHIHIIARYEQDYSYPAPVWCGNVAESYDDNEIKNIIAKFNDYYSKR